MKHGIAVECMSVVVRSQEVQRVTRAALMCGSRRRVKVCDGMFVLRADAVRCVVVFTDRDSLACECVVLAGGGPPILVGRTVCGWCVIGRGIGGGGGRCAVCVPPQLTSPWHTESVCGTRAQPLVWRGTA